MCGIVGAVSNRPVVQILLEGLKKLEYRGYDSAGVAVIENEQTLKCLRVVGKVRQLEQVLDKNHLMGKTGIAHTRWATHGIPSEKNAHPFTSHEELALVHNGIIENHAELRRELQQLGYKFDSDTDTEVVVHLIHHCHKKELSLHKAVRAAVKKLQGAYALAIIDKNYPDRIIAVRQGSPLVIGQGLDENFVASDPLALLNVTQSFIYLKDDELAIINPKEIIVYDQADQKVEHTAQQLLINYDMAERGKYRHYMQKEIMEQPKAIHACLEGRIVHGRVPPAIFGFRAETVFPQVKHIVLVACGTSYHAALVARYWLESMTNIPCTVEIASEFRYRDIADAPGRLFVALSQSGETADTLAAMRLAKELNFLTTLAICNVPGSTMTREADLQFMTHAGIEIGVASTKAFVTQLTALMLLTLALSKKEDMSKTVISALERLPEAIESILSHDEEIADIADTFMTKQHALFIGRGILYPIALEGALKMKEISYIHAEGYPAGELKHGPLALVDPNMPIIATAPNDHLLEKTLSNLQEVRSRGGKLTILSDDIKKVQENGFEDARLFEIPYLHPLLNPILYTIPLQLLSYHVACLKGTDVDQPRNLAKSVTVE